MAPGRVIGWVKEAGLGRLRLPVAEGGGGATVREFFAILIALAEADAKVAHIPRAHFWFVEQQLQSAHPVAVPAHRRRAALTHAALRCPPRSASHRGVASPAAGHRAGAAPVPRRNRRQDGPTSTFSGIGQPALPIGFEWAKVVLEAGDERDAIHAARRPDHLQQMTHHPGIDADVLGLRRLAHPGRDEDMARPQAGQSRPERRRIEQIRGHRLDAIDLARAPGEAEHLPALRRQPAGQIVADDTADAGDQRGAGRAIMSLM